MKFNLGLTTLQLIGIHLFSIGQLIKKELFILKNETDKNAS